MNPTINLTYSDAIQLLQNNSNLAPWSIVLVSFIGIVLTVYFSYRNSKRQEEIEKLKMFYMVMERLEYTRKDRDTLRAYIRKIKKNGLSDEDIKRRIERNNVPNNIISAVDRICHEYDLLGLLDHNNFIDHRLVDGFYSVPLVDLYDNFLRLYIKHLQSTNRGPTHYWELDKFYERVKLVPRNHPSNSKANDWPKYPRDLPSWLYGIRKY